MKYVPLALGIVFDEQFYERQPFSAQVAGPRSSLDQILKLLAVYQASESNLKILDDLKLRSCSTVLLVQVQANTL